jgi:hypothetical protein
MQEWFDLIPVAGALLSLAADITNLTVALTTRREAIEARKAAALASTHDAREEDDPTESARR